MISVGVLLTVEV